MLSPASGGGRSSASDFEPLDTVARVDSPEQIQFEYRVAGPARRTAAYAVDFVLKAAILLGLGLLLMLSGVDYDQLTGWSVGLFAVVIFAVEWGYNVMFESLTGGRTPGKRVIRLRVVKEGGHPINFMDALLRNLLRAADFLPSAYALGVAVMGFDPRFRRLGDLLDSARAKGLVGWIRARSPEGSAGITGTTIRPGLLTGGGGRRRWYGAQASAGLVERRASLLDHEAE